MAVEDKQISYRIYLVAFGIFFMAMAMGDLVTLYAHTGPISQFGSWGLREYADQDPSEAPKWRAVQTYLK